MKMFSFVLKHISGKYNIVVDALRRRSLVLQEIKISTLGYEHLKEMYKEDPKF